MEEEVMDSIDCVEVKEEILNYNQDTVFEDFPFPSEENRESTCTSSQVSSINYPIVYTTRLEEMKIFKKKLKKLSPHSIINCVIAESKPKVSRCNDNIKQNESSVLRFLRLLRKLQIYNHKVAKACRNSSKLRSEIDSIVNKTRDESKLRESDKTQSLIDLCKPLTIKLIDCKYLLKYPNCTKYKISSPSDETGKCKKFQYSTQTYTYEVSDGISKVDKNFNTCVSLLFEAYTKVSLFKKDAYKRSLELYPLFPHNKSSQQYVKLSNINVNQMIKKKTKRKQTITTKVKPGAKTNVLNNNMSNKKISHTEEIALPTNTEHRKLPTPILHANVSYTNKPKTKKLKTTTKKRCRKINALSKNRSDEPAGLKKSSVSSQVNDVTVQNFSVEDSKEGILMETSNAESYFVISSPFNQANFQYLHAPFISLPGPITANVIPVLIPVDNDNTNSFESPSEAQNLTLLQSVECSTFPVQENYTYNIHETSEITINDKVNEDEDDGGIKVI